MQLLLLLKSSSCLNTGSFKSLWSAWVFICLCVCVGACLYEWIQSLNESLSVHMASPPPPACFSSLYLSPPMCRLSQLWLKPKACGGWTSVSWLRTEPCCASSPASLRRPRCQRRRTSDPPSFLLPSPVLYLSHITSTLLPPSGASSAPQFLSGRSCTFPFAMHPFLHSLTQNLRAYHTATLLTLPHLNTLINFIWRAFLFIFNLHGM